MAQTITLTTRAFRSGTITTAGRNIQAGTVGSVMLRFDIAEPDLSDPAKTASLQVQRRTGPPAAWLDWAGMTWQDGPATKPGANRQPSIGGDAAELAGWQVRLIATLDQPITAGLVLELP